MITGKLKQLVAVVALALAAGCETEIVEVCPSCSAMPFEPGSKDGGFIGNPDLGDSGRFMIDAGPAQPDGSAVDAGQLMVIDGGAPTD